MLHVVIDHDLHEQLAGQRLPGRNAYTVCIVCTAMLTRQECIRSLYSMCSNADLANDH